MGITWGCLSQRHATSNLKCSMIIAMGIILGWFYLKTGISIFNWNMLGFIDQANACVIVKPN